MLAEPGTKPNDTFSLGSTINENYMKEVKLYNELLMYYSSNPTLNYVKEPKFKCASFMDLFIVQILAEPRANPGRTKASLDEPW